MKIIPLLFSFFGLAAGVYIGVWVAGFIEGAYSPYASGSDDLDYFFVTAMVISCFIIGLLFSFIGFKIGDRITRLKK
jgi:F0F1-type ATP synthase membrane subunit c/vacuolar-type H+-ATPase subunit K